MTTQRDIAEKLGLDISSVNKILRKVPGSVFNRETVRKVFETAEELGYDMHRLKFGHRRRTPRKAAQIDVTLTISDNSDRGTTSGTAVLKELSLEGGILRGILLVRQTLPTLEHTIRIRPRDPALGTIELEGHAVRFVEDGEVLGLAIEFKNSTRELRNWIQKIS